MPNHPCITTPHSKAHKVNSSHGDQNAQHIQPSEKIRVKRIKVRYRKDPHMQNSMRIVQTKTNTNPNPDHNRYRRRCPDPNARIEKFIHYMAIAAICDSGLSP